ncbi:LamG-like jellyroll fold domain-containing protein [Reichenbachiella versicolor]|uniref:LamG-like jellyroll fold domain-containing protein n=1 Tax=Reichenbachiella versicolor TaxID=1821036 RepID=UPI000D6E3857|nr:LamG-like jellyroll fold domain-containing protein [Reichenbachiella versicolor]
MKSLLLKSILFASLILISGQLLGKGVSNFNYNKCENRVTFRVKLEKIYDAAGVCNGYKDRTSAAHINIKVNGKNHGIYDIYRSGSNYSLTKRSGFSAFYKYHRTERRKKCAVQYGKIKELFADFTIDVPASMSGEGQNFTIEYFGTYDDKPFYYSSANQIAPNIPRVANPVSLEPLCDGVKLSWGKPSFTCTNASYIIKRDGVTIKTVSNFNTLEYVDNEVKYDDIKEHKYEILVRHNSHVYDHGLPTSVSGNPIKNFDSSDYFESVSLSTTNFCDQSVRLQWEIDDKVDIDYFEVERDVSPHFDVDPIKETVTQKLGTISFAANQLPVNQHHYFRVRAYDQCGNRTYTKAGQTQHVFFEGPPSKPSVKQVVPATDGSDKATITWSYPADGTSVDYFQVYRRDQGGSGSARSDKLDPDTFSFEDNGLNNCFEYEYWVVAGKNCFDEANSMKVQQVISFNTDLNGFDEIGASKYYFNDRISVEWKVSNENSANEIVVYRKREGSEDNPEIIKRLDIKSSTFDDYDTDPGVLYRYGVLAISCPEYKPTKDEIDNMMTDIGVYSETGIINGKLTYEGGNAVRGARVLATPSDGENRGVSMSMVNNQLTIPLENQNTNWFPDDWTLSFWFRLHDKSSGQKILNVTNGTEYLSIGSMGGGTESFNEYEYEEVTNIVGVSDELIGFLDSNGEVKSYSDESILGQLTGSEYKEFQKESLSGLVSNDTIYDFKHRKPWLLKQGNQWFSLNSKTTKLPIADSLIGYFKGDSVYESFDSDFVLAFVDDNKLYQAEHFNIKYELGDTYAYISNNQIVFASNPEIKADITDDIVYAADGTPIHMIKGNNVYYLHFDDVSQKLVRGKRFARKVPNTTDPLVAFDIKLLEKTVTEEIRKGAELGLVSSDRDKIFDSSESGLIKNLIDPTGVLRTTEYVDTLIYEPVSAEYGMSGHALVNINSGVSEYLFNNSEDSLYSITVNSGILGNDDYITDASTGDYIFFLGEIINGDRQFYKAVNDTETNIITNVINTYTKEVYQAQLDVKAGNLSSSESILTKDLYLGEYNNLMLTYDGDELVAFLNGNSFDTLQVKNLSKLFKSTSQEITFGPFDGLLDETLLWSTAKDSAQVKKDYNRYLGGGEEYLVGYWRLDEKVSTSSFDASYSIDATGDRKFNKHNATLDLAQWSNIVPEQEDLSFTSFTDKDGNYSIQSIIYAGRGNNFKVVPMLGTHRFEPSNKVLFIGPAQQIQNEQNFRDKSAFRVTGTVKYDPTILGFSSSDDPSAPNCYVEGVKFFIDDQPVLKDNNFYLTDKEGRFDFDVPIGKHTIRVEKDKHSFTFDTWPPTGEFNFQDEVHDLIFYDNTTRTVIGKVVGGASQGEKTSGEGFSINNIGTAQIKLKSIGKSCYETIIETNPITGEYRAELPPFRYNIVDINIPTQNVAFNRELKKLAELPIDLANDQLVTESVVCLRNCQSFNEEIEYHVVRDFVYRTPSKFNVLSNNPDPNYLGDVKYDDVYRGKSIDVEKLPFDLFTTNSVSIWKISITEDYYNHDDPNNIVHYPDTLRNEKIIIDNEIASEIVTLDLSQGFVEYAFRPAESSLLYDRINPLESFTKSVQIRTERGQTWREQGDIYRGYVLGGVNADNEQSFYTVANEGQDYQVVDFILRDPPGSQSYSSLVDKTKVTKVRKTKFGKGLLHESSIVKGTKFKFNKETPVISWTDLESKTYGGAKFKTNATKEGEETSVFTFDNYLEFSTSKINKNTGAGSDLFIGNAMNVFVNPIYTTKLLPVDTCTSRNMDCFSDIKFDIDGVDYTIGRERAIGASIEEKETFFYYTQRQLEEFIKVLDRDYKAVDQTTNKGKVLASRLRNQSRIWKSAIAQNEYEKLVAKYNLENQVSDSGIETENISFAYGSNVERDYKVGVENSFSSNKNFSFYGGFTTQIEFALFGAYMKFNLDLGYTSFASESEVAQELRQQQVHFSLKDDDPGDQYSVDVVLNNYPSEFELGAELARVYDSYSAFGIPAGLGGFDEIDNEYKYSPRDKSSFINPIFITRGGRTSCPYEPEEKAKYLNYLDSTRLDDLKSKSIIKDFMPGNEVLTYEIVEDSEEDYVLNYGTFQRDQPGFRIEPRVLSGIPWDGLRRATFDVFFDNLNIEDTVRTYKLLVDQRTTGAGPTIRLDGERFIKGTEIPLYGGETLKKSITVRPVKDVYDYENIVVYLVAGCQFDFGQDLDFQEDIFARDTLSVYFDPVCPLASVIAPTQDWIINNSSGSVLPFEIQEQQFYFENHEKIKLQFKASYQSDEDWVDIAIWSNDSSEVKEQRALGFRYEYMPRESVFIADEWDTEELNLPDGAYQIRWHYKCSNGLESYSEPINGVIDTTSPHVFGRPSPADGVLSPDDEILLTLNEPIEGGLVDRDFIQVKGKINGTPLSHPVGVRFSDSQSDQVTIPHLQLRNMPLTIEMWIRRDEKYASTKQQILSHSQLGGTDLSLSLIQGGYLELKLNNQTLRSDSRIELDTWSHIALSLDTEENKAALYHNSSLIGFSENFIASHFATAPMILGGSGSESLIANIHELRLWSKYMTAADLAQNYYKDLTGREIGLLGYWPLNEGKGDLSIDKVQSKNAQIQADWFSEPASLSFDFNGNNPIQLPSLAFTDEEDFTIEFWFKSALTSIADTMTLVSNGDSDHMDWEIGINKLGQIILNHDGQSVVLVGTSVLDEDWHHLALAVNRVGHTRAIFDGEVSSVHAAILFEEYGGPATVLGSRLSFSINGVKQFTKRFTGQIDEFRIWRMAKSQEQIQRMSHYKLEGNEFGLACHMPFEDYDDFLRISHGSLICNDEFDSNLVGVSSSEQYSKENPGIALKPYETPVYFNYSVNGDKIIITLDEENPETIENCVLDISVRNLIDQHGNVMKSPVTWSVFVDRNQVTWKDRTLSFEKDLDVPLQFKASIQNTGGEQQEFVIDNLPTWISATPASGLIEPDSEQELNFTINRGLNIGEYQHPIHLRTDFGFNESLLLNIKVAEKLPEDWNFNPDDYQYTMNFIGQIMIHGKYSIDDEDIIGVFVNGEMRGKAALQYQEVYDNYQAFLSVYSNEPASGEKLEFRIWDASEGKVLSSINIPEIKNDPILFGVNELYGRPSSPVTFTSVNEVLFSYEVPKGWKWVSFNLTSDDLIRTRNLFEGQKVNDGDRLLSIDAVDVYDEKNDLWIGTLGGDNLPERKGGIDVREAYRVYSQEPLVITYSGVPADPLAHEIDLYSPNSTIKPRMWNWVGYLGQENISVNEALSSLQPNDGDIIKSQYAFAIYDPVLKWVGNLEYLSPGEGYLMQVSKDQTLVFPSSSLINSSSQRNTTVKSLIQNNFDPHQYSQSMTVTARIVGLDTYSEFPMLKAYSGKELRGVASVDELNGQPVYYLTVFGEANEDLRFEVEFSDYTHSLQEEYVFQANHSVGLPASPVTLTYIDNENINLGLQVFPNPFDNQVKFVFQLDEDGFNQLRVFTMDGKLILDREFMGGSQEVVEFHWNGIDDTGRQLGAGIYLVKFQSANLEKGQLLIKE